MWRLHFLIPGKLKTVLVGTGSRSDTITRARDCDARSPSIGYVNHTMERPKNHLNYTKRSQRGVIHPSTALGRTRQAATESRGDANRSTQKAEPPQNPHGFENSEIRTCGFRHRPSSHCMYSSNAALPTVGCSAARERRNSEKRHRCSVLPAATMRARTRVFAPHAARG